MLSRQRQRRMFLITNKQKLQYLSIFVVIFSLQIKSMLLNFCVSKWLQNPTTIGSKEII